jgi:hypothetical protein
MDNEQVEAAVTNDQGNSTTADTNPEQTGNQAPVSSSKKKRGLIVGGAAIAATGAAVAGIALFKKFKKRK